MHTLYMYYYRELKSTLTAMKEIEAEKSELYKQTKTLQSNLQV